MTNQPSWITAPAVHLPESTSEMFVYQPQGDVNSMWLTVAVECEGNPLRLEFFTPEDGEICVTMTGRKHDLSLWVDEGSSIDFDFANPAQRRAFFRMILELADWIKEHHTNEHSTGNR